MRISDWSSDVCSSDLAVKDAHVGETLSADQRSVRFVLHEQAHAGGDVPVLAAVPVIEVGMAHDDRVDAFEDIGDRHRQLDQRVAQLAVEGPFETGIGRSEEHTSELQSLMRISYAVFCLKKKKYFYLYPPTYTH